MGFRAARRGVAAVPVARDPGIYALYPTRKDGLPKVRLLIDYLVQSFADMSWPG